MRIPLPSRILADILAAEHGLVGHDDAITSLAFSPDSRLVATAGQDGQLMLWDARSSALVRQWRSKNGVVRVLEFSPDSRLIASIGSDEDIHLWPTTDTRLSVNVLRGHTDRVNACAWSRDGMKFASVSDDGVRIWDPRTQIEMRRLPGGTQTALPFDLVAISPDGRWLLASGPSSGCHVWSLWTPRYYGSVVRPPYVTRALTFASGDPSRDVALVGAISENGIVQIIRVYTFRRGGGDTEIDVNGPGLFPRVLHTGAIGEELRLTFSPASDALLVTPLFASTPQLWYFAAEPQSFTLFKGHSPHERLFDAAFSPDGQHIATASEDGTVRVWRVRDGACIATFSEHDDCVSHVAFSADGEVLASGARDGTVCIRRLRHWVPDFDRNA